MTDKKMTFKTKKPTFAVTDGVTLTYSTYEGIMVHADAQEPVRISEADVRTMMYWLKQVLDLEDRQRFRELADKVNEQKPVIM